MAVCLLAALIALGLVHVMPQLVHWRGDGGFRRWVAQLGDTSGPARVAVTLGVPVVLCVMPIWVIDLPPGSALFQLVLSPGFLRVFFRPSDT